MPILLVGQPRQEFVRVINKRQPVIAGDRRDSHRDNHFIAPGIVHTKKCQLMLDSNVFPPLASLRNFDGEAFVTVFVSAFPKDDPASLQGRLRC
jgi:hypothetical protein